MRLQDTAANCGPASVSNALSALGISRTQAECEVLCKTSGTDGTSARNIIRAVQSLGCRGVQIRERRELVALLLLDHWLNEGAPIVLCVDQASHWVAAVGRLGPRILIADPADNELVLSLKKQELLERWASNGNYYGVVL